MKPIIIIIAILLFSCRSLRQDRVIRIPDVIIYKPLIEGKDLPYKPFSEFNSDTLKYVEANFLHRNGAYVNKPSDTLFADLEIPVVGFLVGISGRDNRLSGSVSLSFFKDAEIDGKLKNNESPVILVIEWATGKIISNMQMVRM